MRRSLAVGAVMVVATVLTACGPPPPGTAAQVGDTRISMHQLDDATTGFCLLVDDPEAPVAAVRSQALSLLLLREAAEIEAGRRNLQLDAADLQVTSAQRDELEALAGDSAEQVLEVYEANLYVQAVAERIVGAAAVADAPQGEDPGIAKLAEVLRSLDVEVDPRFPVTIDGDTTAMLAAGEVPVRDTPPTQLCG